MHPPRLIGYVREQLLHTVAVMVKRATLEDGRERLFNSAFSTVSQLLAMDTKRVREGGEREGGGEGWRGEGGRGRGREGGRGEGGREG